MDSHFDTFVNKNRPESLKSFGSEPPSIYIHDRSTSFLLENRYAYGNGPRGNFFEPITHEEYPKQQTTLSPWDSNIPLAHEVFFVGVVAVSHLMTHAGLGKALAPIEIIAKDFGVRDPVDASWVLAAYSLTVGTFILISGRLGDILGHKRVFCFGYAWFGMWSAFAGFGAYPKSIVFFNVCRALQGIGPALLMPNGLALFGRFYPPGIRKNIVFSIFGGCAPLGFVIGAFSGSIFGQLLWWPWAFWTFALTCFVLCGASILAIPKPLAERPAGRPAFDWTGSVTGIAGLVLFNVAWNNGPVFGWSTPHVYFTLIIGLLFLAAFCYVEARAKDPILPIRDLTSTVGFVLACVGVGWAAFSVWVVYAWRWVLEVRHTSPIAASAQFVPAVFCGILSAGLTGFLLTRTPVSFVMLVSTVAFLVGSVIAGTMPPLHSYWAQLFFSVLIMPFGMDMSFPAATIILSDHMPRDRQGLAASLVNTVVNYAVSLAVGIAGTVEVTSNPNHGPDATEDQLVWGLRSGFYTGIVLAVGAVILGAAFFARSLKKEGWKVTEH